MPKSKFLLFLNAIVGVCAATAFAQPVDSEFYADIVQKGPQGPGSTAKMYVGKDRIRTEITQNDQQIVHIVDNNKNTEWVLYPSERTYMQMRYAATPNAPPSKNIANSDPCQGRQGVTCVNLGDEKVSERDTTKWEMTFDSEGKTMTQWIDIERGIPLRRVMPDGSKIELRLLGSDTIGGRPVEKWETVATPKDETPQSSFQWYDPKLGLAIKEEFPGGYIRELRNISEGEQPDELFSIPAGYKQMSAPAAKVSPQQ